MRLHRNYSDEIFKAFNTAPIECLKSEDLIVVFEREIDIELANPDFGQLMLV